jgi:hypothetical protein
VTGEFVISPWENIGLKLHLLRIANGRYRGLTIRRLWDNGRLEDIGGEGAGGARKQA